jgi:hypothetical protein
MMDMTEMFHELQGFVAGHYVFHSRSFFLRADQWSREPRPARRPVVGRSVVIDPKYDSCTKRAQLHMNLAFAGSLDPAERIAREREYVGCWPQVTSIFPTDRAGKL